MARNFSDVFSSDQNEQDTNADVRADQDAESNTDASNDGIMIQNESYSRDEDGNEFYDSTTIDTGNTDLVNDLDLGSTVDSLLNSSSSSESTEFGDS